QSREVAQCLVLCHPRRQASRPGAMDLQRPRRQVGGGAQTSPADATSRAACDELSRVGGCLMHPAALRCETTWAEDRAPQRCDLSAVPGAKTEARATSFTDVARTSPLRDWHQSV